MKTITGAVKAACGCVGTVREAGTRLAGQWPVVSVLITVPCQGGHPHRVAAGVTERWAPADVEQAGNLG